jgi:hypothetical protein
MNLSKKLRNLKIFWNKITGKKIGPDYHNLYHPDFEGQIEPATLEDGTPFIVKGVKYYRFISDATHIPWGRYMIIQTYLHEQGLRIDRELLKGYCMNLRAALSGKKGNMDLNTVYKIASQLESRCDLAFEEDTTYRLASVIYFDDQEDLYGYDKKHNDAKIAAWKEAKCLDFFYAKPMSELLGLNGLSRQDLQNYIENSRAILQDLTIETPEP